MGSGADGREMSKCAARLGLIAAPLLFAGNTFGQAEDKEPTAILEIGGAGQWGLKNGSSHGPNLSVEITPIENWLELEAGVTPLFSRGQTEWESDFLFKKPYTLSGTAEFMFGVGPSWSHKVGGGKTTDTLGAEAALDSRVLAMAGPKGRLVCGAQLRIQFRRRARAITWGERGTPHCHPLSSICSIDPSIIPSLAIDRIDILADCASAGFGSDAIAGVIHIVLKRGHDRAVAQRHFFAPDAAAITSRR